MPSPPLATKTGEVAGGVGGGREERGKGEEKKEIRSPYLARARVERGGGFTRAGGGGWR